MNLISQLGMSPYRQDENEEYMNENQLLHFRNLLNAWKTHLLNTSEITEDQIQDDATKIPDSNDRASYESNLGFLLKKSGRERRLVARIEKSIAGIEKKTYGYCSSCNSNIGLKRLEARPVANECIDCKSLAEEAEGV
ncbi:MAG: RNA polymerase-binding protein DksA [Pseudomonadota bacterium]|nr:RNA polymerase-binding protein DksA [Pseudomonadota bacterium]